MREIILGTAGHVDHGKTSLIRALTGIETDRLQEEKTRGITIELGFAHLDLPCGHRLGIVDVPGHEKFVRNMVAGAAGMDLVAFVIAADEGIMPQTIEHFAICRLLGVRDGIIVLTKKDMVEPDWLEMVSEEVRDFFQGSFLAEAALVAVDSLSGDGLDELVRLLDAKVAAMGFHEEFGPFRMAVDRVFSMKGFGTVITGTALAGRIALDEELMFYPGMLAAKVRGIQVHGQEVAMVEAGHRTAINLQSVDKSQIQRGDMAATPGSLSNALLLDADCTLLPSAAKELKNRTLVRVHLGGREITGRVSLLTGDSLAPGERAFVQLLLQEPVAVWPGDRYVLRSYSPITTIGGGSLLKIAPKKRKRTLERDQQANLLALNAYATADETGQLCLLVEECGSAGLRSDDLAARSGIFGKKLKKLLQYPISSGALLVIDSESRHLLAASAADLLKEQMLTVLTEFHAQYPLKTGLAKEELRSRLRADLGQKTLNMLLTSLVKQGRIEQEGAELRLAGHKVTLQADEQELEEKIEALYLAAGLTPPNLNQLPLTLPGFTEPQAARLPTEQIAQVVELLVRKGHLVRVNEALCFHSRALAGIQQQVLDFLRQEGEIDAPRFKELSGLTRKFSIPLLEYFDKIKLTIRIGDKRVLRKA